MRHCLGVNLLGLHILGTVIVCGFPEAQYRRPQQAPPLVLDLKVQQRPFTSFRNTPSHTTRPAFPPQQVEPGYPRVPQLLPFTPQDARPFTPYIRTLPEQRKLVDRDAPTVNKQQIPHFLLQNAKLPKKSRDISMNEASYLMVMTKPQHESMQDYALLESADDISKPNAPNEVPLPYPETPKFTSTISEMSEVSITTPKPKVARRPNSQIISTTPTSSTLDSPPVVRVTKSSRVSSSKGKKPSVVKQQLSEHRESKRSPQQLDLHYIPSFRRRQGGNGGISNLASHISGNIYGGRQYPVVPIPEISHHQHYGGINTLMGYGLQYPSTPVPFSTVPTLYGGHINQIPITYRIPMYTTGASLLPSQTFGIPNLSPFQESLLSPYYRTPEYQMVQPLVALNYMNGNPIVPNYESYPVSTPYYPLVTSHPGYHLQQHLNNFPIYEEAIQKNNTNIYRHSQEEDDLHRFIEKQRRPSVTQVRQPPNGHFPPVFMKQRPTTISYPHPLGILARFPEDISLPPIYRPPSDSRSAFSNGFTPVAILPQGYDFQVKNFQ